MGGAVARAGEHESAFSSRDAAYSLLVVGIADVPGVEEHAATVLRAMRPWTGGHRLPNFTFSPEEYVDAYDELTLARLRRAIRTYDPYLPNFTFSPEEYVDAYDELTLARLRRAIRTYDPYGVMAIGRVLTTPPGGN